MLPAAAEPARPPHRYPAAAGTAVQPARQYNPPGPLTRPARAAEGSDRSRPAAGATAPLPPGAVKGRGGTGQSRRDSAEGRRQPLPGAASPYLPASGPAAARNVPALIARCYSYGSRSTRLSREAPSSRESRGPRRGRLLSREGGRS